MSYFDFINRELFNHQKGGGFRPNSLFTRTVSDADLDPIGREPYALALPIHIHEYIHYLHNISTPTGISYLLNEINSIYAFLQGTNEKGLYIGSPENILREKAISRTRKIMSGGGKGDPPPQGKKISAWEFSTPTILAEENALQDDDIHVSNNISIPVLAKSTIGERYSFTLYIGLNFITEGIAYDIDRDARRRLDIWSDLDESTPPFPYLAYKPLIEHLLGRKSTLYERVIIGTCALLSQTPGEGLITACRILKSGGTDSAKFVAYFVNLKTALETFSNNLNSSVFPALKQNVRGSPELEKGLEIYLTLISQAIEMRTRFPFMELGFCAIDKVDDFYKKIAAICPQWICQEKGGDGNSIISWIGNPETVHKIDDVAISVLQSIFHYVQSHHLDDGLFKKTSELENISCPFSGACLVQRENNFPPMCRTKPWALELNLPDDLKGHVCYYNAAVRSLHFETK